MLLSSLIKDKMMEEMDKLLLFYFQIILQTLNNNHPKGEAPKNTKASSKRKGI